MNQKAYLGEMTPFIHRKNTKGKPMKHQSKASKMDESLGMRKGKESKKMQSMKDRRHESEGMSHHEKAMHHMKMATQHMKKAKKK